MGLVPVGLGGGIGRDWEGLAGLLGVIGVQVDEAAPEVAVWPG